MDALHPIRLRWTDWGKGSGHIRADEIEGRLRQRPPVLRHVQHLEELDFAPGVFAPYLQERGQQRRDLEAHEIAECQAYVDRVSAAWRIQAESDS